MFGCNEVSPPSFEPRERAPAAAGDAGPALTDWQKAVAPADRAMRQICGEIGPLAERPVATVVVMHPHGSSRCHRRTEARIFLFRLPKKTWLDDCAEWRQRGYRLRQRRLGVIEAVRVQAPEADAVDFPGAA